jgi:(E)-4-hydroxy-3-methylbut-2-enyl-diphosphate synthase
MHRKSLPVKIGSVVMGGGHPVVVQSMTNTDTGNVKETVKQIIELAEAGSEIVRFTVRDEKMAKAVKSIKEELLDVGCSVPLVGDFHYNGNRLLKEFPDCAESLDKYRINPGNVGFGETQDKNFKEMVGVAKDFGKPVRIGVNWGSLDQALLARMMDENARGGSPRSAKEVMLDALVESALQSAQMAVDYGLEPNKIVLSAKVSEAPELFYVYEKLAGECNYALHLGLTEAGGGSKGIVASSVGIGVLLHNGIGDTIRCSLTPRPGESRAQEVIVSQQILQELGLRQFFPRVTSCPGCGRTTSVLFQEIAKETEEYLRKRSKEWKQKGFKGFESMIVAVMGCIVNGPGESRMANIGLSLPGSGEDPVSPVYADGKEVAKLHGAHRIQEFHKLIDKYVEEHYGK